MTVPVTDGLLVSLPDGFHLHGFLNTGLARRLIDSAPAQCTFLMPPGAAAHVPESLRAGASWIESPRRELSRVGKACRNIRLEATHCRQSGSDWELIRRKHARGRARTVVQRTLGGALGRLPALDGALRLAERTISPSPVQSIIDAGRFRTIVFGSAGIKELDSAVDQAARAGDARRYGIVYSWDNLSSKFNAFVRLDRLAVWNHFMKATAVERLGFHEEQVAVVGVPQFDLYHDFAPRRSRAEFLAEFDLPPEARYWLYIGVPQSVCPWGEAYLSDLLEVDESTHALVRAHPQDRLNSYRRLLEHPRVRAFLPGHDETRSDRQRGFWLPKPDEGLRLAEQIVHAEAVISVASTVTLEGVRLERPTVNLAYDIEPGRFPVPMERYYASDHFRHVTESGAVPIVRSPAELCETLRSIPAWFNDTRDARASLRRVIDPFGDGGATQRLADDLLQFHRGDLA